MNYLPTNSLKSFIDVPQARPTDVGGVNLKDTVGWLSTYMGSTPLVLPDLEAVEFYCLNHLASVVRACHLELEGLPLWAQEVMLAYQDCLTRQSSRMFAYLLLIVTREARHLKSTSVSSVWYKKMPAAYKDFHKGTRTAGNGQNVVSMLKNSPPDMPIGEYLGCVLRVFGGSFQNGYGGPAWANVARVLVEMVTGKISMEMMVDQAYSLAHNNGPIFNKGMLYKGYTDEFIKILDVQNSGQLPELVLSLGADVLKSDLALHEKLKRVIGVVAAGSPATRFGECVDWARVESAGSKKKYVKKLGKDWSAIPTPAVPPVPKKPKTGLEVMPGVFVKTRKRAA